MQPLGFSGAPSLLIGGSILAFGQLGDEAGEGGPVPGSAGQVGAIVNRAPSIGKLILYGLR